jgi:hypothetical protein
MFNSIEDVLCPRACVGKIEITRNADFAADKHVTMLSLFQPSQYDCVHVMFKIIKNTFHLSRGNKISQQ